MSYFSIGGRWPAKPGDYIHRWYEIEEVRIMVSILKICMDSNETDNCVHGLTGNLVANIDSETGRLSKAVGSASSEFPYMRSVSNHPDNMQPIQS